MAQGAHESVIVSPPPEDETGLVRHAAYVPSRWKKTLEEVSVAAGMRKRDWGYVLRQLLRYSSDLGETPPMPEGRELAEKKGQTVFISRRRLTQIEEEADRRGWGRNDQLLAHIKRALDALDAEQKKSRK